MHSCARALVCSFVVASGASQAPLAPLWPIRGAAARTVVEPFFDDAQLEAGIHAEIGPDDAREHEPGSQPDPLGAIDIVNGASAPHLGGSALVAVAPSGELAAIDADNTSIAFFDARTLAPVRHVGVGAWPEQLVAAPDGTVYVSCRGARSIDVIQPGASEVHLSFRVGAEPTGLGLSPDARTLVVAHAADGTVMALDAITGSHLWVTELGEPLSGVLVHPRGHAVYVSRLLEDALAVLSMNDGDWFAELPLDGADPRQPHRQTNAAGAPPQSAIADLRLQAPVPSTGVFPRRHRRVALAHTSADSLPSAPGSTPFRPGMARALAPSPGGLRIFAPHELADQGSSVSLDAQFSRGYGGGGVGVGPLAATVSVFDAERDVLLRAHEAPDPEGRRAPTNDSMAGARTITSAVHHPTRSLLFVASLGTDEIFVLNTRTNQPAAWVVGAIRTSDAPIGLAISRDGDRLYVLTAHGRRVEVFDLTSREAVPHEPMATTTLADSPWDLELQRGRSLFHSTNPAISSTGMTCASCHPDGRQDARVWSLHLGPRQTPMLAGRLEGTAPYNWLGSETSLDDNIANTITRLGGFGLPDEDRRALARYIEHALPPLDNPHRAASGELTAAQANGKALFESADVGCSGCHQPDAQFADAYRYDVGTTSQDEIALWRRDRHLDEDPSGPLPTGTSLLARLAQVTAGGAFSEVPAIPVAYDTPSLHGLHATAPYFHDGSAEDLHAVITRNAEGDHMGTTSHLDNEEINALVAYLLTL